MAAIEWTGEAEQEIMLYEHVVVLYSIFAFLRMLGKGNNLCHEDFNI